LILKIITTPIAREKVKISTDFFNAHTRPTGDLPAVATGPQGVYDGEHVLLKPPAAAGEPGGYRC